MNKLSVIRRKARTGMRKAAAAAANSARQARGLLSVGFLPPPDDGMQNFARMRFLYESVRNLAPRSGGVALEVGVFKAGSTVYLAKAALRSGIERVIGIDLFTGTPSWNQSMDTLPHALERVARYGLSRSVTFIRSHSLKYDWKEPIAVLHLDADHEYSAVAADIAHYAPHVIDEGIIVFDDYDTAHPGVLRAVHELLSAASGFEVAAINYQRPEYGSLCVKRNAEGNART
ncbi:MAG: class I SAM-dependent methyltransferase [Acidobacteriota bacterium]|nr:class I SAM-dependent methyltransferase [Acidobacteriota bacterium]